MRDPKRERESKVFYKLAKRLADQGSIPSNQQFRHENGAIWGMKLKNQVRIACFQDGRLWACTHAFQKNGNWRTADFDRANAIRDDYFQRKTQP